MPRKLLVVDDLAANRRILKEMLCGEYEILEAQNGREALDMLASDRGSVCAVLLDISMPVMNGYETLRRIRCDTELSHLPVVMITGSESEDTRIKALAFGANDFVTKPYSPELIRHCLRNNIAFYEASAAVNALQCDKLTGLFNREAFFERVRRMVAEHEPGHYIMACFDIDKFKIINDQYGTLKGDEVLRHTAHAFREGFEPNGGICCRVSADNFAVLYPAYFKDSAEIVAIRERASRVEGLVSPIIFSIGRYLIDDITMLPAAMYDRAMLAVDTVKGRYDSKIAMYDESMREHMLQEQEIVTEMEQALNERQFEVWFQPQYNYVTDAMIGAEALVRWVHPQKGLISPNDFIPVFEQNGFIYSLDKFVWEEVCIYLRKWMDTGRSPLPVSVNISRYDIFCPDVVETVKSLINKYGLPIDLLRLEITESAFSESSQHIVNVVKEFVDYGFTVEIDDFGSGYSSLNTLKDVPAQIIKLDMKFLEDSSDSQRGGNIVESIVRMAKWIGMSVIAEGVETLNQANFLRSIGCCYMQGYLFAKPMPGRKYDEYCNGSEKEERLLTLETVENLDNNSFWDPKSMDTLIFNSYVGGACIYEYCQGNIELLRASEKYAQVIGSAGMTVEDALRLNWVEHLDIESGKQIIADLEESIATKKEVTGEYVFLDLPGCPHETYLRSTMRVIASAGVRYLVYCTNENITAQRQSEKREREVAEEMRLIMKGVNGGICAAAYSESGEASIIFANDTFYSMYGYTKEQFERELDGALGTIHPDDRQKTLSAVNELVKNRGTATYEYRCIRRDGSVMNVRCSNSVTSFAGISDTVLLSVTTDTTELALALQKEKQAAEQLQAIMKSVNGGISVMTVDQSLRATVVFANDRYYAMLGYTKEQFHRELSAISEVVYPEDRRIAKASVEKILCDRIPCENEYRCVKRDGSVINVRASKSLASIEGYGDDVVISVITDISELVQAELRAQKTAEQLQVIMKNISGGVTATVLEGEKLRLIFANDRHYEQLGYTKAEYEAQFNGIPNSILPADREMVLEHIKNVSLTGMPDSVEFRIVRTDGEIKWLQSNITAMDYPGETQPVQLAVANDITEQRKAEQKIIRLSEQMQTIMDNVDLGIIAAVAEEDSARYLFTNGRYYEMLGYTKEQFEQEVHSPYTTVAPEDRQKLMEETTRICRSGEPAVLEYCAVTRDGRRRNFRAAISIGRFSGVDEPVQLSILRDVTEEVETEQRERRFAEQLRVIMRDIGSGITAAVLNGEKVEFLFSNDRYYEIHGYTRAQYDAEVADNFELIHSEDRARVYKDSMNAYACERPMRTEYRIICRDGSERWVRAVLSSTHFTGVKENVHICIFTDITEEKRSEEMLLETDEQLRFIGGMSHELLAQTDADMGINAALNRLMEYFRANRAYIFEFDYDRSIAINTYEVCAEGVSAEIDNLKEIPLSIMEFWMSAFRQRGYYAMEDIYALDESRADEKERLLAQNIESLFVVPLKRDGGIIGMIGVDDPRRELLQVECLMALGDYIAVMLTRRDLNARISSDNQALLSMMSDMPGGFVRMQVLQDGSIKPIYFNEGFFKLTGMGLDTLMDIYANDAFAGVHPDDVPIVKKAVEQMFKNGEAHSSRYRLRHGDGGYIWLMIFGRVTKSKSGDVYLNIYYTDMNAQVKEEETQKELLDNLPGGAALYEYADGELAILHLNKRYWELVGRTPTCCADIPAMAAAHPDDAAVILSEITSAIKNDRDMVCDIRLRHEDAGYRPFHLVGRIVPVDNERYYIYAAFTSTDAK